MPLRNWKRCIRVVPVNRFPVGALLLAFLLSLASTLHAADSFRVLVSIKPIHSIIAALMQDTNGPDLLIKGKQTPYDFQLNPSAADQLQDYDLIVWVGPELESSIQSAVQKLPKKVRVVELLSDPNLKILPSRDGSESRDPYFWLDNRNVIILVDEFTKLLQDMDPARGHVYARNRRTLAAKLAQMDREYEYGYHALKASLGLQYYDTLQYFEQAYALKVLDRVSVSPRQPVDTARLLKVREDIVDGEAGCLLLETGLDMPNLSLLTGNAGLRIGHLDSLGTGLNPGPDLYFQLMQHNTDEIKHCLRPGLSSETLAAPAGQDMAEQDMATGRFMLTDHLGRVVSDEDLKGKFNILYFGYTSCPDICPTSLYVLSKTLDLLGGKADLVQPYFITVDPERDTVEVMRGYVKYFDKRLIGLTGNPDMIARLAAQYKVKYEKVLEKGRDPNLYVMDHSASLYLVGPDGKYIRKFLHGITPEQLHSELLKYLP